MKLFQASVLASAILAAGCRVARQPPEPPVRILALDRSLPVVVTSATPISIYLDDARGRPTLAGTTPLEIDRIPVTKEIWKHGATLPPPTESGFELEQRKATRVSDGEPRQWVVSVPSAGGTLRRVTLQLIPEELPLAFQNGRVEFVIRANPTRGTSNEP